MRVGEPGQGGDAGLVTAYGAGLERGTTGNNSRMFSVLDISHFAWSFVSFIQFVGSVC